MRRSLPVVALVLALALAACDRGGRPAPRRSPASPVPSADGQTPSVIPVATDCTLVLGFSVTADWYHVGSFETQPGIDDAEWEAIALGGHDLAAWANPGMAAFTRPPFSPCGRDPDRVVFQIALLGWQRESVQDMDALVRTSIANIQSAWPSAGVVELMPVVGGPDGETCPYGQGGVVDATAMNPVMNQVIADVANGSDVVVGPNPLVSDCSQFADVRGHLTQEGSQYIASELAKHYAAST
jgi:hypothetical protein